MGRVAAAKVKLSKTAVIGGEDVTEIGLAKPTLRDLKGFNLQRALGISMVDDDVQVDPTAVDVDDMITITTRLCIPAATEADIGRIEACDMLAIYQALVPLALPS